MSLSVYDAIPTYADFFVYTKTVTIIAKPDGSHRKVEIFAAFIDVRTKHKVSVTKRIGIARLFSSVTSVFFDTLIVLRLDKFELVYVHNNHCNKLKRLLIDYFFCFDKDCMDTISYRNSEIMRVDTKTGRRTVERRNVFNRPTVNSNFYDGVIFRRQ